MAKIKLYDTTLRDGSQGEGISFSVQDKINIARKLDLIGIHYIEGGWPGSNPKDMQFFSQIKKIHLKNSKITAFGSTRRPHSKAGIDANIKALLKAGTKVVTIFGKTWDLHVKDVLRTTLKENLEMIKDTLVYLKSRRKLEVIYDAEHFFDGYQANPGYALATLSAARDAGCETIVLCDTNGGTITSRLREIITEVNSKINIPLGIHTHNDNGMAVANTIAACECGCRQIQGTINGYGERCGNANLCSIIPNLKLKLGSDCISDKQLKDLTETARFVAETANMVSDNSQPFVGKSAFAHKGGVHVNAVIKKPLSYEHIEPAKVGNKRRILISELSGQSNVLVKAEQLELDLQKGTPQTKKILQLLQELEHQGYQFEAAEASFDLLMKKALGKYKRFFELEGFRVIVEKKGNKLISEATIKLKVNKVLEHTAAEGDGPVNALDKALRKALEKFYPALAGMHLSDFKVRVLNARAGTAAKVRVLIQSQDSEDSWSTVGVHENIIEASWQALVDSVEYKLLKNKTK
ncbi:MAG: citramalate synthase [Candidatus Omnitrophota bacterium]|nr:citramalate synthase [Candidatus Omnitrophota bacterium]